MLLMIVWIGWGVASIVVGVGAAARGRSFFAWFLLSLILSPLLAGFLLLVFPSARDQRQAEALPTPKTHVKCPDCRELVLKDARRCKHCGCVLIPQ